MFVSEELIRVTASLISLSWKGYPRNWFVLGGLSWEGCPRNLFVLGGLSCEGCPGRVVLGTDLS